MMAFTHWQQHLPADHAIYALIDPLADHQPLHYWYRHASDTQAWPLYGGYFTWPLVTSSGTTTQLADVVARTREHWSGTRRSDCQPIPSRAADSTLATSADCGVRW